MTNYSSKEEEMDILFIDLLREWLLIAADGLTEVAGLDGALGVMRPYCKNMGEAGSLSVKNMVGFNTEEITDLVIFWAGVALRSVTGGYFKISSNGIDKAETLITGCTFNGRNKALCYIFCDIVGQIGSTALNSDFETELKESVSWGNSACRICCSKVGVTSTVSRLIEVKMPTIPKETMNYVSLASLGEFWVCTIKAMIDYGGQETTLNVLLPRMRSSGQVFGTKVREHKIRLEEEALTPTILLFQLNKMLHREGKSRGICDEFEGEVEQCPFSGSPPEICLQCESFINGVYESIFPDLEFSYDRLMTKGDKTCHWLLKKKTGTITVEPGERTIPDDPAKILAIRYAKGEITKDDLEERMSNLRKLGLV